ncbi:class I SAM-dependent methyltransferase [Neoroseomonas oryzicola]|uniref:Class I SAM-dependent methyltransferase n=1 Tax=Neoroseomonas oryzicola TaxID=535904 RepID=A0A9X9WCF9_9PROT|nr:class I SAM-dependent methyltransferase [Neoroseomonas oryzicola]MBR0658019.1 class I SAM-dependent methyltransferase [Neoroseomonas oryzicola]NKE15452.1 class I SAM-dependent methyltransferase [Neoroseomonas oryzicola]
MDTPPAGLAPHATLPRHYADPAQRDRFVRGLFDGGAASYDRINAVFSFGSGARYRREALLRSGLAPGQRLLDVATGTGLVAREALAVLGRPQDVIGLDLSGGMLREARAALPIPLVQARAEALPLASESVDLVSMGYALRHVADLVRTFAEYRRVLRPGGRVLLLEIDQPSSPVALAALRFYLGRVVPVLSRWIAGRGRSQQMMEYFWDTIDACVPPEAIQGALAEAGFTDIGCEVQLGIFRAYRARRPDATP